MAPRAASRTLRHRVRARRCDLIALAVIVGIALLFLSPALKDGPSYGGFDLDTTRSSLGTGVYSVIHSLTNGDAVQQMIAWNDLSWKLVHSGHFPLWNQFEALGMPQFLNFESSVLSLPDLLSYLVPIRFAFLVVVFVKLVLAGSGAYLFARVLRCRPLAATFAGVSFMLAGAFAGWLTWPLTDVLAWSGWICAFGTLALRRTGRFRHVVGLAVCAAFSIYGGFPEASIMLAIAIGVLGIVAGALVLLRRQVLSMRGVLRSASGVVLGALLATPLWLPGLQIISQSHREIDGQYVGLPTKTFALLISQGYFGLPTGPAPTFTIKYWNYYESVSYVGVIAIVLALVAIGTSWRRPAVVGLVVALVVSFGLTYQPVDFHPLFSLVNSISGLSMVRFERMRTVSAFLIAVLAALGLEETLRAPRAARVRNSFTIGVLVAAGWVAYLDVDSALAPAVRHQRFGALVWPTALAFGLVLVAACLWVPARRAAGRGLIPILGVGLVAVQAGFLFFAGVGIPSYSTPFFKATPAIASLQAIVGDQLVGLDGGNVGNVTDYSHVGFFPNVNVGYSIREFGIHDPLVPDSYFVTWPIHAAAPNTHGVGLFVPDIDSVALARRYGVAYILTAAGRTPPTGTVRVADLAGETLSRVPGSAEFSFAPSSSDRVVSSTTNGDGAWSIQTAGDATARLMMRVTWLPGFHATIDGRPLALSKADGLMLQVVVPPGTHTIVLTYLPRRLELGVLVALLATGSMVLFSAIAAVRRRRRAVPFEAEDQLGSDGSADPTGVASV